ncbi:mannitol-1-phosphate 5-dehydrogenase [Terrilactibacillus sp. BCM23-1]|uniref:Mannitol-1-phosphate 5-dehydrogenase n=1 Tax=Terrilactibacillus tamarindi TaxID=2599694 RepID=A0A6N8CSE3_9BACI|nr:mannitol-1-phosphate 5-dehydrogenase [Terrilactibacillus tamarindi]MTT32568.1 mannitol-1-phosphate 5-dehydrogenase [Terrilactibacillus tamarindi]
MQKVVHFGAGNIGRGFIGALFSESGYEVIFVDIADDIINALNIEGQYNVYTASEPQEMMTIQNVSGLNSLKSEDKVIKAIKEAKFITTAIGPSILPHIAPLIAKGLSERIKETKEKVYVIACENQISATDILKSYIDKQLDPSVVNEMIGSVYFLNSAVDRIVPIQHNKEILDVLVESYHEWVVESAENIPKVAGMKIVPNLAPYIERKLFTVNTGHAVSAYFGFLSGKSTIDETLNDPAIYKMVKETVEETGNYLIKRYKFDPSEHKAYIEKILQRFQNTYLKDDVKRVGRSPIRKLGPEDRLIKPAKEAQKWGLPYTCLANSIAACLRFDVSTDKESVELQRLIRDEGIDYVLKTICQLDLEDDLAKEIIKHYKKQSSVTF